MTTLKGDSRVVRETAALERGRPLVVELRALWLRIRPKGARYAYEVDYQAIFHIGALKAAQRLLAERQRARQERRGRTGGRRP